MKTVKWLWWVALLLVLWKLFAFVMVAWNGDFSGDYAEDIESFVGIVLVFALLSAIRFFVWFLVWFFEGPKQKKTVGPTMSK